MKATYCKKQSVYLDYYMLKFQNRGFSSNNKFPACVFNKPFDGNENF